MIYIEYEENAFAEIRNEICWMFFFFCLFEYQIISGGVKKVIWWSLNWYKFINYFSGKLLVLFKVFFFRDRLGIAQKFPNDGRSSW